MPDELMPCTDCRLEQAGWLVVDHATLCQTCYEQRRARETLADELGAKDAEIESLQELNTQLDQTIASLTDRNLQIRTHLHAQLKAKDAEIERLTRALDHMTRSYDLHRTPEKDDV